MRVRDLAGQRFGRLLVIDRAPSRPPRAGAVWRCRCICGGTKDVFSHDLIVGAKRGQDISCGCSKRTHGRTDTNEYFVWTGMLARCLNPSNKSYFRYGGRGIAVCARWRESFENFFADMGERPSQRHTLDRIDNDGPYSPENCRWATHSEQARNRRSTRRLTHQGTTQSVTDWSEQVGIQAGTILARLRKGWAVDRALTAPHRSAKTRLMAAAPDLLRVLKQLMQLEVYGNGPAHYFDDGRKAIAKAETK
jgi:hypothetical protein